MPYKIRKATKKNNVERKKTRYFVHTRTSRVLSRVRRRLLYHFSKPLCITISTEGLTQEQIDLLKELERKGLIPKITWITSAPNSINDKMNAYSGDTRSPIPVISVHSVGNLQYRRQS